jgi:hypothetical protein
LVSSAPAVYVSCPAAVSAPVRPMVAASDTAGAAMTEAKVRAQARVTVRIERLPLLSFFLSCVLPKVP